VSPENLLLYATKVHQKSIAVEVVGFSVPFFVSDSHASSEQLGGDRVTAARKALTHVQRPAV
jgi:hypothetical protein